MPFPMFVFRSPKVKSKTACRFVCFEYSIPDMPDCHEADPEIYLERRLRAGFMPNSFFCFSNAIESIKRSHSQNVCDRGLRFLIRKFDLFHDKANEQWLFYCRFFSAFYDHLVSVEGNLWCLELITARHVKPNAAYRRRYFFINAEVVRNVKKSEICSENRVLWALCRFLISFRIVGGRDGDFFFSQS